MKIYNHFAKPQIQSLLHVYNRDRGVCQSFLQFRRTAFLAFGDCLMVPWKGMVLGIEKDGYTHS